jgi:Family of unknown function (DUF6510)
MANNLSDLLIDGDPCACLFEDIFTSDITLAKLKCIACGSLSGAGSLSVHQAPEGAILRCASCGDVLMKAERTAHGLWFEMAASYCVGY